MRKRMNNKGMTLIEIVVVLVISSIIMGIVGGMILSTMGYFSEEVVADQDKEGLDDIATYLRKELSYATNVVASSSKPSEKEWQWLSIVDGKLYKNDAPLLEEEFYNKRSLSMGIQGFDNYRLDIHLTYQDTQKKIVYSNTTALELMNFKATKDVERKDAPFSKKADITNTIKLYYIQELQEFSEDENVDLTGTVQDQLACLNNNTNRENPFPFDPTTPAVYFYKGDIIYYEGYWWMYVAENGRLRTNQCPGGNDDQRRWKKLYAFFDETSAYEKDDVIIYNSKRYKAKYSYILADNKTPAPDAPYQDVWQEVSKDEKPSSNILCKSLLAGQNMKTVRNKLDGIAVDSIKEYYKGKTYPVGTVIKITEPVTTEFSLSRYYMKIFEGNGEPNTKPSSGWQHLARDIDLNSSYLGPRVVDGKEETEVVFFNSWEYAYIKVVKTIDVETPLIVYEQLYETKEYLAPYKNLEGK